MPITGRSGGNWKRTPRPVLRQLVEVRETVEEIKIPKYVEVEQPLPPSRGCSRESPEKRYWHTVSPPEWLDDVRNATEDTLLSLADHLPSEAAEALLDLATGVTPQPAKPIAVGADPFQHPDAQRRFRVMSNVEELERALDFPWEKWTVFLHPIQRSLVERDYNGPAACQARQGQGKPSWRCIGPSSLLA